ncbi:MAG: hypothetical protein HYV65_03045 [Candidatus Spechtbacteria bacterium]|nr:hypothetical protein [Candidatus Spechtbacteria bacterium]
MPDVTIRYDRQKVHRAVLDEMRSRLPNIVAEHLCIPETDGALTPDDIELNFHAYGPDDLHGKYILEIIIDANLYRKRSANLDQRTQRIKLDIALILELVETKLMSWFVQGYSIKDDQWFVWVRLSKASFR